MKERLRIVITGSPATGKKSVALLLCERTGAKCISVYDIAKNVPHSNYGQEIIMNIPAIKKRLLSETAGINSYVIYGNFACEVVPEDIVDVAVVLRCNPIVLYQRYKERGYDDKKIRDNIVAEAIGFVHYECLKSFGSKVKVIDSTNESPKKISERIISGEFDNPSAIDWLSLASEDSRLSKLLL